MKKSDRKKDVEKLLAAFKLLKAYDECNCTHCIYVPEELIDGIARPLTTKDAGDGFVWKITHYKDVEFKALCKKDVTI